MTVIDINRGHDEGGRTPKKCPVCGGEWWRVRAVTLDTEGSVTGWTGEPECDDCLTPPTFGESVATLTAIDALMENK